MLLVPAGSSSRGGDVAVYVFDISHPSLHTPFYSVLVSISVSMALSTVVHPLNSPDNSPLSQSFAGRLRTPRVWFGEWGVVCSDLETISS